MNLKELIPIAITAAEQASVEILEVYNSGDFQAEVKGDNSPLTIADKKAHHRIADLLKPTNLPLLSEEGRQIPYEERKDWEYFWMVDPLDGTKEFLKRNGEFTVNIALIHKNKPVLGVVAVPATGEVYYGAVGLGAFLRVVDLGSKFQVPGSTFQVQGSKFQVSGSDVKLAAKSVDLKASGLRVVASRSHMNEDTEKFINSLTNPGLVSSGSSLKFMLLINGKADVYPRYAPTMEWDTAAAHAVVNSAGVKVLQANSTEELVYNKENLLNPYFICY